MDTTKHKITDLRVYQNARQLEDKIHALINVLPESEYWELGDRLRRNSAATAHWITLAHNDYSLSHKIEYFHESRRSAEQTCASLAQYEENGYGKTQQLQDEYCAIIKQNWGMIKWLRAKQERKMYADLEAREIEDQQ